MPLTHVLRVIRHEAPTQKGIAWALDSPREFQLFDGRLVEVSGWIVTGSRCQQVELTMNEGRIEHVMATEFRADVGRAFPHLPNADQSGFHASIELEGWNEVALSLWADTGSSEKLLVAEIVARVTWREATSAPECPLVSVIVDGNGPAADLRRTVQALSQQSYPQIEIVVVGAPSELLRDTFVPMFPMVRTVIQRDTSSPAAWNTGLRMTTGDYLMFLESDDSLVAEAVTVGMSIFREHSELALVLGPRAAHARTEMRSARKQSCRASHVGLFRRSVFEHIGVFDLSAASALDDLQKRVVDEFPSYSHDRPLIAADQ